MALGEVEWEHLGHRLPDPRAFLPVELPPLPAAVCRAVRVSSAMPLSDDSTLAGQLVGFFIRGGYQYVC
jgi:hypothetical protein